MNSICRVNVSCTYILVEGVPLPYSNTAENISPAASSVSNTNNEMNVKLDSHTVNMKIKDKSNRMMIIWLMLVPIVVAMAAMVVKMM